MHIYIHRDGQQFGPYPIESVRDYLASGSLLADDSAWYEGAEGWRPLPEVLAELEAGPAPADEPAPDPSPAGERHPEPELVQEPDLTPAPEPMPVSARTSEPSWIPPRRDGSTAEPFARLERSAMPGAMQPAFPEQSAPVSVEPAVADRSAPASDPAAPDDTAPGEAPARVKRRRSAPQQNGDLEVKRARLMMVGSALAVFIGLGLSVFTYLELPFDKTLYAVAGGLVLLGGAGLAFGVFRYRKGD